MHHPRDRLAQKGGTDGAGATITVGLAQLNSALGNNAANLRRAEEYIARAAAEGCDLVMFPELYLQGYRADELFVDIAEPIPGPTTARLEALARQHNMYIVMGMGRLEETFPHLVYNSLCFVGPEGLLGYYDKVHLGTFHPYIEGVYFAPGRRAPVFDTRFGRVSLQICYDSWFPELTRTYAVQGLPPQPRDLGRAERIRRPLEDDAARPLDGECVPVGLLQHRRASRRISPSSAAARSSAPPAGSPPRPSFDEEDFVTGVVDLEEALRIRRHWLLFRERNPSVYAP